MHSQPMYLILTSALLIVTYKAVGFKSVAVYWIHAPKNALHQTRILIYCQWKWKLVQPPWKTGRIN